MHVAVIGAGPAGLASLKYLLKLKKCTVEVFERNKDIGGCWFYTDDSDFDEYGFPVYASMYYGLHTNLPKEIMCYSDFKYTNSTQSYISHKEVLKYLNNYADIHKLRSHIQLLTVVKKICPIPNNRWEITTLHLPSKTSTKKEFDVVMVCSGNYNEATYPEIPGRHLFQGLQLHSHEYRKPEPFVGKRVLIVGAGPSGMDIAVILSNYALLVILSHRENEKIKNKFPANVLLKIDVENVSKCGVTFKDGSYEIIDCIIYCTGYKYKHPFLTKDCKIEVDDGVYVKPLYKHMINVEYPTMCFIGIPQKACSLPMYDLQIRFYVEYLQGNMELPSKAEMYEDIKDEIEKRIQKGLTKKNYHLMNKDFVWDYHKSLSDAAKIENIWPAITKLRLHGSIQISENFLNFRNDNYLIIDTDNFIKIN